jgi:processive 1,2-diacylglycerol beta-glucosyltransferase
MRARSFEQWAHAGPAVAPAVSVQRRQCLDNDGALYAFGSWLYNFIQKTWPVLHHIYFNVLEVVPFCTSAAALPHRAQFQGAIREIAPDIVLSTHDHLNHAYLEAARAAIAGAGGDSRRRPPLCGTYCGELSGGYGFSRRWVNPNADFFIGAVDDCVAEARRHGMPAEKSWTGGFVLNPDFWDPPLTAEKRAAFMRENLRLDPDRFTLLLGTGANGANNHLSLLKALHDAGVRPQVIALCGRNDRTRNIIEAWAASHPGMPVAALGYQAHMRRVMECSDALFARPGTGTTSEAIQCGLPVLFNGIGGVMPQELISVRYCRRFFEANVARSAHALPPLVEAWMRSPGRLEAVRKGLAAARPPAGLNPAEILRKLASLRDA